jgi:6-phosphofructokinase
MIYFLTAIGLTPGGSSTVHIYTQTIHTTTQSTQTIHIIQLMGKTQSANKKCSAISTIMTIL